MNEASNAIPPPIVPACPNCGKDLAPTIGLYAWQVATTVIVGLFCPSCRHLLHLAINPPRPGAPAGDAGPGAGAGPRILRPS